MNSGIPPKHSYFIGLMSGTSLDGIDAVLASFAKDKLAIHRHSEIAYTARLRAEFMALFVSAENEIERCQQVASQRSELAAELVEKLCFDIDRDQIMLIGDHGQTVRHCPDACPPFTLQLHDAARLSELTGLTTVVDFRSKDIAAGGQGAPLAPAFHQAFFADTKRHRAIINIGGIANISLLAPEAPEAIIGFDTGPGNTLLDNWCLRHTGKTYDDGGRWGRSGVTNDALLTQLLDDPFFSQTAPKSTGREYFNLSWLNQKLNADDFSKLAANDVQATLYALTCRTIIQSLELAFAQLNLDAASVLEGIYICGGGAYNTFLMEQIQLMACVCVQTTDKLNIPPKLVEAAAFAWLGKQAIQNKPTNLSCSTGARHPNVLGAIYPA